LNKPTEIKKRGEELETRLYKKKSNRKQEKGNNKCHLAHKFVFAATIGNERKNRRKNILPTGKCKILTSQKSQIQMFKIFSIFKLFR
jgi:hypothetical protein